MTRAAPPLPDIRSLSLAELEAVLGSWGEPAYRARQLMDWLHVRFVDDWNQMSTLPRPLRERLRAAFTCQTPTVVTVQGSRDSTQKFLWRLPDGAFLESVLIPASEALYGEPSDRHTLCISTQVGCAYGCRFCASGLEGFRRNLRVEEIVGQVLAVERWCRPSASRSGDPPQGAPEDSVDNPGNSRRRPVRVVDNVVVMGMGEPMANYPNLLSALRILNAPWGGRIGARRITVSTSGLVPQIRQFAAEPEQFRLAISLHAVSDELRDRLMPVNRKYPLRELLSACDYYVVRKGRMITLEYILIAGFNDSGLQARELARLARRLGAKVNLIPYNRVPDFAWETPAREIQERFLGLLIDGGALATLRTEKGRDIDAACGQLRLRAERTRSQHVETEDPPAGPGSVTGA